MKTARLMAPAAALLLTAIVLTACSSGPVEPGDTGPAEPTDLSAEAQEALDAAYAGIGSDLSDLPDVTVDAGQSFYVMSCGEQLSTCHAPAAAMVDAAQAAGWTGTIVDGKLNAGGTGFTDAVRQAAAAGANVISPVGVSCSAAAGAFEEAHAAGVTIVGGGGIDDCDPKAWDSERLWLPEDEIAAAGGSQFHGMGQLAADYAYGKLNGDVKAITITTTTQPWQPWVIEGFVDQIKALGGSDANILADVRVTDEETADPTSFAQKVVAAMQANPDVNVLYMQTDSYLVNGLAAAITQAGFADKVIAIGNSGSEAALDMIRNGTPGITAVVGQAQDWGAWGSIDTAIRVQAGQQPIFVGEQIAVVDKDHNMPTSGAFQGTIDYQEAFKKSWGVD